MNKTEIPLPLRIEDWEDPQKARCCAQDGERFLGTIQALGREPEPFGETQFTVLRDRYATAGRLCREGGAECLLLHGFAGLAELRAAILGCRDLALPIIATVASDAGGKTPCGDDVAACLVVVQDLGLYAFGLTGLEPFAMKPLYSRLREFSTIALAAMPECPEGMSPVQFVEGCEGLMRRRVTVLGQTGHGQRHTRLLQRMMHSFDITAVRSPRKTDAQEVLLADREIHYLDTDLEYSLPVQCSLDMSDALLEVTKEACDVVLVEVCTDEDGYLFAQNAHMVDLPVAFQSESLSALREALFYYNGKAILRSTQVELEREDLERLAEGYGAVVL